MQKAWKEPRLEVRYEVHIPAWCGDSHLTTVDILKHFKTAGFRMERAYWDAVEEHGEGEPHRIWVYLIIKLRLFGWEYRAQRRM